MGESTGRIIQGVSVMPGYNRGGGYMGQNKENVAVNICRKLFFYQLSAFFFFTKSLERLERI